MKKPGLFVCTLIAALSVSAGALRAQQPVDAVLKPTNHPRLPADPSQYWLAPAPSQLRAAKNPTTALFLDAVRLEVDANFAKALPILSQSSLQQGPLGDYAVYYKGLAEMRLGHP